MEKSQTHMEPPKIQQHNTSGRMEDDILDIDIANSDTDPMISQVLLVMNS